MSGAADGALARQLMKLAWKSTGHCRACLSTPYTFFRQSWHSVSRTNKCLCALHASATASATRYHSWACVLIRWHLTELLSRAQLLQMQQCCANRSFHFVVMLCIRSASGLVSLLILAHTELYCGAVPARSICEATGTWCARVQVLLFRISCKVLLCSVGGASVRPLLLGGTVVFHTGGIGCLSRHGADWGLRPGTVYLR